MADKKFHIKYCAICKYYAMHEGVCCNGDSEYCADFRDLDGTCDKWEAEQALEEMKGRAND